MDVFDVVIMLSKKQAEYAQLAAEYDAAITALKSALLLIDEQNKKISFLNSKLSQNKHAWNG